MKVQDFALTGVWAWADFLSGITVQVLGKGSLNLSLEPLLRKITVPLSPEFSAKENLRR